MVLLQILTPGIGIAGSCEQEVGAINSSLLTFIGWFIGRWEFEREGKRFMFRMVIIELIFLG